MSVGISVADWETALVRHYLRTDGAHGSGPLRFLDAGPEELARAVGLPVADGEAVQRLFLASFGTISNVRDVLTHDHRPSLRADGPGWFRHLVLTCLVAASEDLAEEGDFRERMRKLFGWPSAIVHLAAIPSLWRDLVEWCEARRRAKEPYRRIVLPSRGWMRQIGESVRMAFPSRPDRLRFYGLVRDSSDDIRDVAAVLKLVGPRLDTMPWSDGFRAAFDDFARRYRRGDRLLVDHAFWELCRGARAATRGADEDDDDRTTLRLAVEHDEAVLLEFTSPVPSAHTRPAEGADGAVVHVLTGRPSAILAGIAAETQRGKGTLARIAASVALGVLPFVERGWGRWIYEPEIDRGPVRILAASSLRARLPRDAGWGEVDGGWLLSDAISVGAYEELLQKLGSPMPSLGILHRAYASGGIRIGSAFLGRPDFLPSIEATPGVQAAVISARCRLGNPALVCDRASILLEAAEPLDGIWRIAVGRGRSCVVATPGASRPSSPEPAPPLRLRVRFLAPTRRQNMTAGIHLGRCLFQNDRYTRVEPLLTAGPNGWSVPDRRRLFPEVGTLFSVERPIVGSPEGAVWLFRTAPNNQIRAGEEKDLYLAVAGEMPIELLDLSAGGIEEARRAIVEVGLPRRTVPSPEVLVVVAPGECIRLRLVLDESGACWHTGPVNLEQIPVLEYDSKCHAGADVAGRRFVVPGREPQRILYNIDLSHDADFLQKVLRRLRKARGVQPGGDAYDLSNKAIERLVGVLRGADLLSSDSAGAGSIRRRLEFFVPKLTANVNSARQLARTLAEAPPVASMLVDEIAAERERLLAELRAELAPRIEAKLKEEHSRATAEIEALDRVAAERRTRLGGLRQEIDELEAERDVMRGGLVEEVTAFADRLGRASELAARIGLLGRTPGPNCGAPSTPWGGPPCRAAGPLGLSEFVRRLAAAEEENGLPAGVLTRLYVLMRSGTIPLLFGPDAETALRAHACYAVAGRIARMPMDAATLGLDDLWQRTGWAGETTFARSWRIAAEQPEVVALLVLDDVDVHHLATWMPRLAAILASDERPSNLLVAATAIATPRGSITAAHVLESCIPIEVDGGPASAAAAVLTEVRDAGAGSERGILVGGEDPPLDRDLATRLMSDLLASGAITSRNTRRAARVLRAAVVPLGPDDAMALARAVGRLSLPAKGEGPPDDPLGAGLHAFVRLLEASTA